MPAQLPPAQPPRRLEVNNAAAEAPPETSTRAKSGRLLTLIPAASAENEKPRGSQIFSGERRSPEKFMPES